jgi:serine/threonine protein kinase
VRVRRDIAARNILVFRYDPDDVTKTSVKLSDFGLTVNACTATHMYVSEGPKPVRYLAPEALQKRRYSEKSDVWSFGVMGWELLTNGNLPYYDITSDDNVVRHVVGGGVLPAPDDAAVAPIWAMLQPRTPLTGRRLPSSVSRWEAAPHSPDRRGASRFGLSTRVSKIVSSRLSFRWTRTAPLTSSGNLLSQECQECLEIETVCATMHQGRGL